MRQVIVSNIMSLDDATTKALDATLHSTWTRLSTHTTSERIRLRGPSCWAEAHSKGSAPTGQASLTLPLTATVLSVLTIES